ncbi:hypothetical protein Leryth_002157 [Lithospermum erythrorhizon]|nr:hypothetical protein Leryth_002157 [Lithospermum erythrorhizon]
MALRVLHILSPIIYLSIVCLVYHEFYAPNIIHDHTNHSTLTLPPPLIHRKQLAIKFDFTPFMKQKGRHYHRKHSPRVHSSPGEERNEIDHRYGVEKRLVPSGPNPLHH